MIFQIALTSLSLWVVAATDWLFSFSLRPSLVLVLIFMKQGHLNIILWDSGSDLNLLFQLAFSATALAGKGGALPPYCQAEAKVHISHPDYGRLWVRVGVPVPHRVTTATWGGCAHFCRNEGNFWLSRRLPLTHASREGERWLVTASLDGRPGSPAISVDPECGRPRYQLMGVKVPTPSLAFLETIPAGMLEHLIASLEIYAHHLAFVGVGVGGVNVFL